MIKRKSSIIKCKEPQEFEDLTTIFAQVESQGFEFIQIGKLDFKL